MSGKKRIFAGKKCFNYIYIEGMEKIISNKAASFVSMELARYALERADLRASSILTAIATTLGVTSSMG